MNDANHEHAEWLEELDQASLLTPDEPRRRAVEAAVAQRGGLAQARWLALHVETERLRLALADAEPPEGLRERLLALPSQSMARGMDAARHVRRWALVVLAAAAASALLLLFVHRPQAPVRLPELARLVIADHLESHTWDVSADDAARLEQGLQSRIPFPVRLPPMAEGVVPVGGRRCTLGGRTVCFTAWRSPRGRLSLIQLRRDDFGLAAGLPLGHVRPDAGGPAGAPSEVLVFGDAEYAWLIVADEPRDLEEAARLHAPR